MNLYKPYLAYKDFGMEWLGKVPKHWEITPFRNIVAEKNVKNENGLIEEYLSLMANVGIIPYEEKCNRCNKQRCPSINSAS